METAFRDRNPRWPSRGDTVVVPGDPPALGVVRDVKFLSGRRRLAVRLNGDVTDRWFWEDQVRQPGGEGTWRVAERDELLRRLLLHKLDHRFDDHVYAYRASRTNFEPYQFKPLFKFFASDRQRLLIADEVGLGKTIEACLIFLELKARTGIRRTLVVCPSGLREKWRLELLQRFGYDFVILDRRYLSRFVQDERITGGQGRLQGIVALELIRRQEVQQELAEHLHPLDLVIVDEAHHARNETTETHRAVDFLIDRSDAALLLTATPLQTKTTDLFNLLSLLDPDTFDDPLAFEDRLAPNVFLNAAIATLARPDATAEAVRKWLASLQGEPAVREHPLFRRVWSRLSKAGPLSPDEAAALRYDLLELNPIAYVFTRTRKRDVASTIVRDAWTVRVPLSPEEGAFYDAVLAYARSRAQRAGSQLYPFVLVTRERQAASCLPAMRSFLEDAMRLATPKVGLEDARGDLDANPDAEVDEGERRELARLLELGRAVGNHDTKLGKLLELLERLVEQVGSEGQKAIVFSFFRRTIQYIQRELSARGIRVYVLHGDVKVVDRHGVVDQFRQDTGPSVLLSTEVGAEGLDLQFCNTIVNYDLPWNPMRLEQRIGRIDRYGQERPKVHIANFVLADTVEDRILTRLYERIGLFEATVGDLEEILGEEIEYIARRVFTETLTPEEEIELAHQVAARIANRKIEQEQFEAQSWQLLSHDAIVMSEVDETISSGRHVSAAEQGAAITEWLARAHPNSSFEQTSPDLWFLRSTPDLTVALQEYVAGLDHHSSRNREFLRRLVERHGVPCTFDGQAAQRRSGLELLNLDHPLVRAAVDHAREVRDQERLESETVVSRLAAVAPPELAGLYVFIIAALRITSVRARSLLIPFVYEERGARRRDIEARLLRLLQEASKPAPLVVDRVAVDRAVSQAHRDMDEERERYETDERARNEALLAGRLASLDRSYSRKIEKRKRWLAEATNPQIQRMREAEIANLEAQWRRRRQELEGRRMVLVDYQILEQGLIQLLPGGES
jgi:superfamily II DNA/RNA helicase